MEIVHAQNHTSPKTTNRFLPLEDPRIGITKARLQDALIRLCQRQAFPEISVASLCREANVARKTLYVYYADVEAIATEIVQKTGLEIAAELRDAHLRMPHSSSGIFQQVVTSLTRRRPLVLLICRRFPPDAVRRGCLPVIEKLFDRAEAINGLPRGDEIARTFWCETFASSIATMFKVWARRDFRDDPRVFVEIGQKYLGPGVDAYWLALKERALT